MELVVKLNLKMDPCVSVVIFVTTKTTDLHVDEYTSILIIVTTKVKKKNPYKLEFISKDTCTDVSLF